MNAPTLEEQGEITRFGMFDEEIFQEIVERFDDDALCKVRFKDADPCGNTATHRARCVNCGAQLGLVCDGHVPVLTAMRTVHIHPACGAEAPLCELIRVVPL